MIQKLNDKLCLLEGLLDLKEPTPAAKTLTDKALHLYQFDYMYSNEAIDDTEGEGEEIK